MEYYSHIIVILSFVVTRIEVAEIRLDLNNSGTERYVLYMLTEMWMQKSDLGEAENRGCWSPGKVVDRQRVISQDRGATGQEDP